MRISSIWLLHYQDQLIYQAICRHVSFLISNSNFHLIVPLHSRRNGGIGGDGDADQQSAIRISTFVEMRLHGGRSESFLSAVNGWMDGCIRYVCRTFWITIAVTWNRPSWSFSCTAFSLFTVFYFFQQPLLTNLLNA